MVIKLKEPYSVILALIGENIAGSFWIMPRETDGGFDIRQNFNFAESLGRIWLAVAHHCAIDHTIAIQKNRLP